MSKEAHAFHHRSCLAESTGFKPVVVQLLMVARLGRAHGQDDLSYTTRTGSWRASESQVHSGGLQPGFSRTGEKARFRWLPGRY